MQPESQRLVDGYKQSHPEAWKQIQSPFRDIIDAYDAKLKMTENPSNLQEEMDSLNAEYVSFPKFQSSISTPLSQPIPPRSVI